MKLTSNFFQFWQKTHFPSLLSLLFYLSLFLCLCLVLSHRLRPHLISFAVCLSHICCVILSLLLLFSCCTSFYPCPPLALFCRAESWRDSILHALNTLNYACVCVSLCVLGWCHPGLGGRRKQGLLNHDLVATGGEGWRDRGLERWGQSVSRQLGRHLCLLLYLFFPPSVSLSPGSWLILFLLFVLFFCVDNVSVLLIHLFQRWYFGLFCASSPMPCCATFFPSTALCCFMVCFAPCCSMLWFIFFTVVHPEVCSWLALYCLKRQLSFKGAPWQK